MQRPKFLAGDRRAGLIVNAAARRGLDLGEAHLFDRWWWLRLRLVTDWQERSLLAHVYQLQHNMFCGLLSGAEGDALTSYWEQACVLVNRIIKTTMPWMPVETKEDQRRKIMAAWCDAYGNPNDPDTQAKIRATALALIQDANRAIRGTR